MSADRERQAGSGRETPDGTAPAARGPLTAPRAALVVLACPLWGPLVMRRMDFFRVRRVEILGAHYVPPSDILAKLHVDTMASVWDPTAPLAKRVAGNPGIRSVEVRRRLPGTLVVEVTERVPIALVPAPTGFQAYDTHGGALPADPTRVAIDAPVIEQRDTTILRLLGEMRETLPALYDRVSTVRRVGKARDEVVFELATLPVRTRLDVSLNRLAEIDPVLTDLARRQVRVAELDLRYRDQVIARFP
jgi:cell division protein FtsQ